MYDDKTNSGPKEVGEMLLGDAAERRCPLHRGNFFIFFYERKRALNCLKWEAN
jgi:hypothetical protein